MEGLGCHRQCVCQDPVLQLVAGYNKIGFAPEDWRLLIAAAMELKLSFGEGGVFP
jgi:hypothetical protein